MVTNFIAICSAVVCFNLNQGSSMLILTTVISQTSNHSVMPSVADTQQMFIDTAAYCAVAGLISNCTINSH